jgi:hypothetical protein
LQIDGKEKAKCSHQLLNKTWWEGKVK